MQMDEPGLIEDSAKEIFDAEWTCSPVEPLAVRHPSLTPADAYAIQEAYAALRRRAGARLVGRKIGCTSKAVQELFGIDTPDYGQIFDDMVVEDGGSVAVADLIQPMVEPELAFLLAGDLRGPGVIGSAVLEATASVAPCLEVIDSRIVGWQVGFVDTVADNGSSSRCVLGEARRVPELDLAAVEVEMSRDGEVVTRGRGDAALGHPADSVAWLANALAEFGHGLEAGDYVLSGSLTTAIRVQPGNRFAASFTGLGDVSIHFT